MKKEIIVGTVFILASGFIYTFERFLAILVWASEIIPVKFTGTGQYSTLVKMPSLLENIFVIIFFVIGFIFLILGFMRKTKLEKQES